MKKYLKLAILIILILPIYTYAHPGGTDSSGCHTCKTNCSNWGLSYGEYHCHANKGSPQQEYPISSTYGSYGTGYTTPNPSYAYPSSYSSYLDCPLHSYSDGTSCKCNYGYSVSGGKCVDDDQICQNQLGYNSSYDSLTDKCKCSYGYVIGSSGQCISGNSYCSEKIGLMSEYDSLSRTCGCMEGYEFDGYQCSYKKKTYSSYDDSANYNTNVCPENSSISLTDNTKCSCNIGYVINSIKDGCVFEPIKKIDSKITNTNPVVKKEPVVTKIKNNDNIKTNKKISASTTSFNEILKGNQNLYLSTTTSTSTNNRVKKISWFTKFINLFK